MRKEGNRNFGVWNPPTGMDSVRQSTKVNSDLVVRLNNLKIGKELGIRQSFGKDIEKIECPDTKVAALNNKFKIFEDMIKQGWGGNL